MASSMRAQSRALRAMGPSTISPSKGRCLGPWATPARARAHAEDAAEARGDPQAAAEVGACREPDLAGGQRRRRAAGGAPAGLLHVPRVARLAEDLVEGVGAGAELGRVGLADDNGAARLQGLDQQVRARRHMVGVDRRAPGGAHALHRHQVLDRDGHAAEPAARALGLRVVGHDALGMGARAVDAERRDRVEMPVGRRDALRARLDQLQRRDLAPAEQVDNVGRGQSPELAACCHCAALLRPPGVCGCASRYPAGRRGPPAAAAPR